MVQELPCKEIGCNTEWHHEAYYGMPSPNTNWTPPSALKHCPAPLHREHHTQTIVTKALTSPSHLLHDLVEQSNLLGQQRFKSRHPFSRHAARLLYSQFEICESWITAWQQVSRPARLNIAPIQPYHLPLSYQGKNWCPWIVCELVLVALVYSSTAGDSGSQLPANAVLLNRPPNTWWMSAPTSVHLWTWTFVILGPPQGSGYGY